MPEISAKYLTDMSRNMDSMFSEIKNIDRRLTSFDSAINSIREDISGENIAESISKKIAEPPNKDEVDSGKIASDVSSMINSSFEEAISKSVSNAAAKSFSAIGDKISSSLDFSIDSIMGDLKIPGLRKGGIVKKGGSALVGEDGPELLNLPESAEVMPLGNENNSPVDFGKYDFTEYPDKLDNLGGEEDYVPRPVLDVINPNNSDRRITFGESLKELVEEISSGSLDNILDSQSRYENYGKKLDGIRDSFFLDSPLKINSPAETETIEKGSSELISFPPSGKENLNQSQRGEIFGGPEKIGVTSTNDFGSDLKEMLPSPFVTGGKLDQDQISSLKSTFVESLNETSTEQDSPDIFSSNRVISTNPMTLFPSPEPPRTESTNMSDSQSVQTPISPKPTQQIQTTQSEEIKQPSSTVLTSPPPSKEEYPQVKVDNSELLSVMKQILNVLSGPLKIHGTHPIRPNSKFN